MIHYATSSDLRLDPDRPGYSYRCACGVYWQPEARRLTGRFPEPRIQVQNGVGVSGFAEDVDCPGCVDAIAEGVAKQITPRVRCPTCHGEGHLGQVIEQGSLYAHCQTCLGTGLVFSVAP